MTTNPFQSILQQPGTRPIPANDDQEQPSLNDMIAGIFRQPSISQASGADAGQSTASGASRPSQGIPVAAPRPPLRGGTYTKHDAILLMNQHYCIGWNDNETAVFRKNDDGTLSFVADKQFKLEVQNISVQVDGRRVPVETYWKGSPYRDEKTLVFKPGGTAQPHEYNLWRGFAVEASKGWQKQRRFLRHLLKVICRRNKQKFKYLVRLLAWFVQNPDKQAGVVLVLKSREEGTGKSTVSKVMLDIFGRRHGVLVDDKNRLLGNFNDWLETACFVAAEEILFAGDRKSADKMKSMITSDTIQIEGKYRTCRQVPNRLKIIETTNHDHAFAAGVGDRRHVAFEVSSEHANDRDWFDPLYDDLENGGTSEFLWLLLNLDLANWHPRIIIKTEETAEQQRMSGDSASQWSQSCIDADAIVVSDQKPLLDLGALIAFPDLSDAYTGFCRKTGQRPMGHEEFGRACTKMFGPRTRLPANPANNNKRPWGYHVPSASNWQLEVDKRLGVR
jgi:hypothetical protein